ncbi:type IX secretion system plug protein [Catalinimonas niigatensis]|uniref:type IX secretion system plug protein n=1 Tax=Catalinimonas niigatensis TaxID=1397264 RepID=UPI0026665401|nr:type IX secretion system plug protein domain-containing protein [Catalinimonas niigatensis]WPP53699.1 DUF5103 domain-containing protein [Catalinimonas niigatensis]
MTVYLASCVPITGTSTSNNTDSPNKPGGLYNDEVFSKEIQSIKIVQQNDQLYDAVIDINQNVPTLLVFDWLELGEREIYGELSAKIIHCNADWQQSKLYSMDYLYEFNEFPITNEELSYNTKVPFARYAFPLPRVKLPGNYAVVVYERNNENNPLFTRRFMVYEPRVSIRANITRSSGVKERDTHHQLEFLIDYQNFDIPNPFSDVYVVIRQNQQWFNMISGLKPSFVREDVKELEYIFFDLKNNFWAANEFRYFDLRTSKALGQNVAEIKEDQYPMKAYLLPDRARTNEAYSQYNDLNGGYIAGNLETGGGELNADYLTTHFFLDASEPVQGDVYVIGAFNNRVINEQIKMQYDEVQQGYTLDILLKQGFYNYLYYVDNEKNSNPYLFDGSHFETENLYEIFVYTRPLGSRSDLLIGYSSIVSNLR